MPKKYGPKRWKITKFCSRDCYYKSRIGKERSENTKNKIRKSLWGENHFAWKKKATYGIVHYWLKQNYDQDNKCEECKKEKLCDWAKIRGKKYERKRENFKRLCRRCHKIYDLGKKYKGPKKCLDCGIVLKSFYAERCRNHAQQLRFKK